MSSDGSPTETFTDLIAEISIDPRLIKLLGRSMYDSHPLVLVVRETLQNSRDACLRRGIEPEIHITVKLLPDQKAIVICRDNGIGMTAEELIKYFLRLGGTGKEDDPQSVGGLGLAKAVIMGGDDWSIHTRNYRTSMQDIIDRHPIRIVDFIDGTEVMTKIERKCYFSDLINAYLMAALSDVRVRFTVIKVHWSDEEEVLFDQVVGTNADKWKRLETLDDEPGWDVLGSTSLAVPNLQGLQGYLGNEGDDTARVRGRIFVRLGGLVQFEVSFGKNPKRDSVLFIDLKSLPRPGTSRYPLTTSRESLTDWFRGTVYDVILAHCANPITSTRVIKKDKSKMAVLAGEMLRGRGNGVIGGVKQSKNANGYCLGKFEVELESRFRDEAEWDKEDHGKRSPTRVQILLKEYPRKKVALKDWRVMMAWGEIMRLVASGDEEFGIGLSGDNGAGAERIFYDGQVYYVINPSSLEQLRTLRGKILWMWHIATHEFAHKAEHDHGEVFDMQMSSAAGLSADEFAEKFEHVQRVLTGKEHPDLGLAAKKSRAGSAQLSLDFETLPERTLGEYINLDEDIGLEIDPEVLTAIPV